MAVLSYDGHEMNPTVSIRIGTKGMLSPKWEAELHYPSLGATTSAGAKHDFNGRVYIRKFMLMIVIKYSDVSRGDANFRI